MKLDHCHRASCTQIIESLRAENESLRRDAERYRWWRKFFDTQMDLPDRLRRAQNSTMLDAAIDAASRPRLTADKRTHAAGSSN